MVNSTASRFGEERTQFAENIWPYGCGLLKVTTTLGFAYTFRTLEEKSWKWWKKVVMRLRLVSSFEHKGSFFVSIHSDNQISTYNENSRHHEASPLVHHGDLRLYDTTGRDLRGVPILWYRFGGCFSVGDIWLSLIVGDKSWSPNLWSNSSSATTSSSFGKEYEYHFFQLSDCPKTSFWKTSMHERRDIGLCPWIQVAWYSPFHCKPLQDQIWRRLGAWCWIRYERRVPVGFGILRRQETWFCCIRNFARLRIWKFLQDNQYVWRTNRRILEAYTQSAAF